MIIFIEKFHAMKPYLILAFLFMLVSCTDSNVVVTQRQPLVPVLKYNKHNNVLNLKVTNNDSSATRQIREFVISTEGTTYISDIASVSVFYTGSKETGINEKSQLITETSEINETIKLKSSFDLKGPENHFRISYTLKDEADISGLVSCSCESIFTDKGKGVVEQADEPVKQRIGVAVRKHNDDGVHTYRIPGLVTTNNGTLLACYDVRRDSRRDLQGNIDIGISRSTDGGSSWEPMMIALDMGEYGGLPKKFNGVSDAALLVDKKSGDVIVAGLWMHGVIDDNGKWVTGLTDTSRAWNHQWRTKGSQPGFDLNQTSQFLIARSKDNGRTWSEPVNLTRMCKKEEWWLWAPAPGNGITMENGTLVLPTQGRDKTGEPFSNITYSTDGGTIWKTSKPAYTNTTECAVAELEPGTLMLNMRNNRNRNNDGPDNGRAISVTGDMGETWTEHPTSRNALPEPVCMGSLYRHHYIENGEKKSILFFSNPDTKRGRHHITIKASTDNGETWPEKYRIMLDEGTGNGYSCITSVDNDHIGILYEGSQADMVFQKIRVSDFFSPRRTQR
jgi:sialidase-1